MIELMMTLLVVTVILTLAIPSFREFRLNNRMTGAANDLLGSLQLARSEAIKQQRPVVVCASANPEAAPPVCDTQFSGWVVWVDEDNDAAIDAAETVIHRHAPFEADLTFTSDGNGFVSYQGSGFAQSPVGGNPATTHMLLCDERGDAPIGDSYRKRAVFLSATGRPSVLKTITDFNLLPAGERACP